MRPRQPRRRVPGRRYLTVGIAVVGLYFLIPSPRVQDLVFDLVGASAVIAILVSVRRNRPARRWPWLLFAAGQGLFVLGDVTFNAYSDVFHVSTPFPSPADGLYLAGYPLLAVGLALLVRYRTPGRDRASLIDAGIIASGIGLVSWIFVMAPFAHERDLSLPGRLVSIAYPLADVVLLAVAVRLSVGPGKRSTSYSFLLASLGLLLVADTLYTVPALGGSYQTGSPIDAGWLLSYVLFGAAALHPSMRTLSERVQVRDSRLTRVRLAALAAAAVIAPAILGIQGIRSKSLDVSVVAAGCIFLFLLVLMRMAGLVKEVQHKVEELRTQGAMLTREQEAVAELRELNRMKTEFVAVTSHELRTPLTSLLGYTKTLQQPQFDRDADARHEFLAAIERQGHRLLELVENLLATSSIERSALELSMDRFAVGDVIGDCLETLGDQRSRIAVDLPPKLFPVVTDRALLARALANLVDNALKYSAPQSVCEVGATMENSRFRLWVRDYGVGIPKEEHLRIFDRFYQVDSSSTRRVGGVGLGLSLAQEIVHALGGKIEVASEPGVGSTFTISLPWSNAGAELDGDDEDRAATAFVY